MSGEINYLLVNKVLKSNIRKFCDEIFFLNFHQVYLLCGGTWWNLVEPGGTWLTLGLNSFTL